MSKQTSKKRMIGYTVLGVVVLCALAIASVTLGAANITYIDTIKILFHQLPVIGDNIDVSDLPKMSIAIIVNLRLPRIILSIMVGALLASSGAVYQSVFRNPMADPFILGISTGAALGAALAIIMGFQVDALGVTSITIAAFIGAVLTTLAVYHIANVGIRTSVLNLILTGVAISYLLSAALSLLIAFNRDALERIVFWMYGSFALSSWSEVRVLVPIFLVTILGLLFKGRVLNIMTLGEEVSISLGIDIKKERRWLLLITSIATATAVSMCGIIGFVGLVVPHAIRLVLGPDNRKILPLSMLVGASFLVVCDAIARSLLPPMEIPIGIMTSVVGAPYFIYLIIKNKRKAIG